MPDQDATPEAAALLAVALDAAADVVSRLEADEWELPTRCTSWSTRDVLAHLVATTTKFTAFASGVTDAPRTPREDVLADDPLAAFPHCRAASAQAWRSADLRRVCRLPFGTFTASEAAAVNAFDVLVHTWDIAQAVGILYEPPPALTALAYRMALRLVTPQAVAAGQYAAPAGPLPRPPQEATWHDVLVLTGRQGPSPEERRGL